jgi:hypothetical protein
MLTKTRRMPHRPERPKPRDSAGPWARGHWRVCRDPSYPARIEGVGVRRVPAVIGVAMAGMLVAGCGGDDGASALRPAAEVRTGEADANTVDVLIGGEGRYGDLSFTVLSTRVGGDRGGAWLEATVRAENRASKESSTPMVFIRCAGVEEAGSWQANSTFQGMKALPAKTFAEGTLNLLVPGDKRVGKEPAPECRAPAYLRLAQAGVSFGTQPKLPQWRLPDDQLAELNAKLAAR